MRRMILPASLLLALSSFAMPAPIYKWVDAEGAPPSGAQPPQGAQATTVNTQTAPPPDNFPLPPSTPAPTIQQKPADPEQKAIDDKVKQQVAKEEAERKQFCEETRNNLAQLKNNPRVRVDEGKGELRRLGEEERQERIAKAEKAIQENCR
ncbi:DUF4124 domain-containing protein [Pseudomonas aeruginosa]|uniref:DUF4124 domain-containing protein n=1 Tax=Pseudomonas aeruginosa TaxID=287 RepID=UPI000A337E86|nr:DUF4124 domain-containing protein [Pseudomonas aeruginosa]OTH92791.1 glycosyltransferase [Pseudomonas aeruginosa]